MADKESPRDQRSPERRYAIQRMNTDPDVLERVDGITRDLSTALLTMAERSGDDFRLLDAAGGFIEELSARVHMGDPSEPFSVDLYNAIGSYLIEATHVIGLPEPFE